MVRDGVLAQYEHGYIKMSEPAFADIIMGPMRVVVSSGSPTRYGAERATSRSTTSSCKERCTMSRDPHEQFSPMFA